MVKIGYLENNMWKKTMVLSLNVFIFMWSSECSAQGQDLHCKWRNLGCNSAKGRSSTANSGTKAAVLLGIEYVW